MRKDALATRDALLRAGARVFARSGYRGSNVRAICREAGVNLGAINRHFGGKEALYREIVLRAGRSLIEQDPLPRLEEYETAEDALRGWMHYHLRLILVRRTADPVTGSLLMREFRDPTSAIEEFVELVIKPVRAELLRIVGSMLGESDRRALRASAANFVYGMCVFQAFGGPVLKQLGQPPPTREQEIGKLLNLLHPFAVAGVRALRDEAEAGASSRR